MLVKSEDREMDMEMDSSRQTGNPKIKNQCVIEADRLRL